MKKGKTDMVIAVNEIIIDGDNVKPHLFELKRGKKIRSARFRYSNSTVHGTDINGDDFKFNVSDLIKVSPLTNVTPVKKKTDKKASRRRFVGRTVGTGKNDEDKNDRSMNKEPRGKTWVGQIVDTTDKGSTFEDVINVGRARLPR